MLEGGRKMEVDKVREGEAEFQKYIEEDISGC